jgi:hypothetical protein
MYWIKDYAKPAAGPIPDKKSNKKKQVSIAVFPEIEAMTGRAMKVRPTEELLLYYGWSIIWRNPIAPYTAKPAIKA